jgi:hypothetical protein
MIVWMLFVQGDDATWLEGAWDDEMTAQNPDGWKQEIDRVRKLAHDNGYEVRVLQVTVPGVYEAFEIPQVKAKVSR